MSCGVCLSCPMELTMPRNFSRRGLQPTDWDERPSRYEIEAKEQHDMERGDYMRDRAKDEKAEQAFNAKMVRQAYCENESTYGSSCGDSDCPHCGGVVGGNKFFQQRNFDATA